jgi:penicillin-binding protein 2
MAIYSEIRIRSFKIFLVSAFALLFLILFYFQIVKGDNYRRLSENNCIRLIPQEGSRGRIFDRRGKIIAGNCLSYEVKIFPDRLRDAGKVLRQLSVILKIPYKELKSRFRKKKNFLAPLTLIKDISRRQVFLIEELKSDLPGVMVEPLPRRFYPQGKLACHLLGHLGLINPQRMNTFKEYGYHRKDMVGYGGVEEKYDYYLKAERGGFQVEVDHRGRIMKVLGFRPPQNGKDIKLTIDLRLQQIVEDALGNKPGAVILLEPYTGEVLALCSFPNFNPASFLKGSASLKKILRNRQGVLVNRAVAGVYPAGSLFKIVVATAGLDLGKINRHTRILCKGEMLIGNRKFSCWTEHGQQNLVMALAHSCNVFFYHLGLEVGARKICEYAAKLDLGKPTQIDIPYEEKGYLPNFLWRRLNRLVVRRGSTGFRNWYDGDTANLSIGQGSLLVTPLQIARLLAVFANGGRLITPYLVKCIDNRQIKHYRKGIRMPLFKRQILELVKAGLTEAVRDPQGTAHILGSLPISVAGKTGTAQVNQGKSHSWFVGYLPVQKPRMVICVLLEHGGSSYQACLVAKDIIEKIYKEKLL